MARLTTPKQGSAVIIPTGLFVSTAGILALSSLTTLIVILAVKDVDLLASVALALAILAFGVQLIVYVFQASETSAQSRRDEQLHAEMMTVLAQLQERTDGSQRTMDRFSSRLLEAVIGKAANEAVMDGGGEYAREAATKIGFFLENDRSDNTARPPSRDFPVSQVFPAPLPPEAAERIHREMQEWPELETIPNIRATIERLTRADLLSLKALAQDLYATTQPSSSLGPGLPLNILTLVEMGFAERASDKSLSKLYTLTSRGRAVGRIFTARGEPPAGLAELSDLRDVN